jgi:RNA polymerase sigma factor (sigma-70 family)
MEILEMTIERQHLNGKLSEELYESAFPPVARFVSKMSGSFQDAKDIFHDALVIFYERRMHQDFTLNTTAEAYIVGIAKHLWIRKFKQDHKKVSLDALESGISIPQDYYSTPNDAVLLQFLERTGQKCMDLLRAFYYENRPMKDLMQALGYRNEHSAAVQKYKCLEKVRDTIKEKSITYEDFIE